MIANLRYLNIAWIIVAGAVVFACPTAAYSQKIFMEAQGEVETAAAKEKQALDSLRESGKRFKEAKREPPPPGISEQERIERQRNLDRRQEELDKAKMEMSKATQDKLAAQRKLAEVRVRAASAGQSSPAAQSSSRGDATKDDIPPPAGQARPRFQNALGKLQFGKGPTYYWVERNEVATKGQLLADPPQFVRPEGTTRDPFDVAHANVQEEWERDPYAKGSSASKVTNPAGANSPRQPREPEVRGEPSGAVNAMLQGQIQIQRERIAKLRAFGQRCGCGCGMNYSQCEREMKKCPDLPRSRENLRALQDAEQELRRLESQLNTRK